jgi:CheY-like chemotaxis protein
MKQPILIVDDDETIVQAIADILRDEGYVVNTASNGQEALGWVKQQPPQMIFLDMKMPTMDGWAFAATYRAQTVAPAPLIVMTAARDATQQAAEIQAQALLAKPFTIEQLLRLVQRFSE